eukprot:3026021-Pleurochrysis_carterae.AAC.5
MKGSIWDHEDMHFLISERRTCMVLTASIADFEGNPTTCIGPWVLILVVSLTAVSKKGLQVNYGRWILSQLVVMSLRAKHGIPCIARRDATHNALLNERLWQWETEEFAFSANHPGSYFGMKQVLGSVAEEAGHIDEEIVEAMPSSLSES